MKKLLVLLAMMTVGCVQTTEVAESDPIYAKPTMSLQEKADFHRTAIDKWCVDEEGLLLWRCYPVPDGSGDPLLGWKAGDPSDQLWQRSYAMADMPAWQGQYITGLAFEWAVTGVSTETKIIAALNALEDSYKATGVPGVMVRAWYKHDGGRLPWMKTKEDAIEEGDEDQGWWVKGQNGFWYRNHPAGGHHQGVWTAICVLGGLHKRGDIVLSPAGQDAVHRVIDPLYSRIVANGGVITNPDGEVTGYGNMKVYGVNPQYALWHLCRTTAAAMWDVPGAEQEYQEIADSYASTIKGSLRVLVPVLKRLPIDMRVKPNDIHWQHHAWLGLLVARGVEADEDLRDIRRGFEALYQIHEPFNIHNWMIQNAGRPDLNDPEMDAYALDTFEWYPVNKFVFEGQGRNDTDEWQPIQNRKINTAYAKSKPYQKAWVGEHTGAERSRTYQCGFDYLFIYYGARYFGLLGDSQIN